MAVKRIQYERPGKEPARRIPFWNRLLFLTGIWLLAAAGLYFLMNEGGDFGSESGLQQKLQLIRDTPVLVATPYVLLVTSLSGQAGDAVPYGVYAAVCGILAVHALLLLTAGGRRWFSLAWASHFVLVGCSVGYLALTTAL